MKTKPAPQTIRQPETAASLPAPTGSGHLGGLRLLRPPMKEGQCPECAVIHEPEMPHNQQSLFWQYNFMEKNGRWPTWNDALAHCTTEMRKQWVTLLAEHGVIVPNDPDERPAQQPKS